MIALAGRLMQMIGLLLLPIGLSIGVFRDDVQLEVREGELTKQLTEQLHAGGPPIIRRWHLGFVDAVDLDVRSIRVLRTTHREWFARTGHAVLERYGMTETNMNTSNPYDGERVPGAVGFPLPGGSVRVTDPETGKELPREEIGMIEV